MAMATAMAMATIDVFPEGNKDSDGWNIGELNRKVEDLAIGDLQEPTMFGGASLLSRRSMDRTQIRSGGVIRRSRGSRTRCPFALPAPPSRPMFRIPISM